MELDLQSLFGLLFTAVHIGWDPAIPPLSRALLVSQDGRHLFVTPWIKPTPKPPSMIGSHPKAPTPLERHLERQPVRRMKKRVRETGEKGVGSVSANPLGSSLGRCWLRQIPTKRSWAWVYFNPPSTRDTLWTWYRSIHYRTLRVPVARGL